MSDNPRDERSGVPVKTNDGMATQYYLPGCAPDEVNEALRPEVYRFSLLLKGMLRHYNVTLVEAQQVLGHIFRELGRR
jgi:hypothetical protein